MNAPSSTNPPSNSGAPLPPDAPFWSWWRLWPPWEGLSAFLPSPCGSNSCGSLFLFAWTTVEKAAPKAFIASAIGAVGGIANAALFHANLATAFAIDLNLAAIAGLGLFMLALYMLLIHKASVLCNSSYMLFLTVGTILQLSDAETIVSVV